MCSSKILKLVLISYCLVQNSCDSVGLNPFNCTSSFEYEILKLPLCPTISSIFQSGQWCSSYNSTSPESGGYESCPHTLVELRSAAYQKDYASGGGYHPAEFHPASCRMLPIHTSLQWISRGRPDGSHHHRRHYSTQHRMHRDNYNLSDLHIHFIGDSLGKQMSVALQCYLEAEISRHNRDLHQHQHQHQHGYHEKLNTTESASHDFRIDLDQLSAIHISHQSDLSLRVGTHCNPACLTSHEYRVNQSIEGRKFYNIHSCSDCHFVAADFNISATVDPVALLPTNRSSPFHWANKVPPSAKVLVFNTGAWYSLSNGVEQSNAAYSRTLQEFVQDIEPFIASGHIVVWIALPVNEGFQGFYTYEWPLFSSKNEAAKLIFKAHNLDILFADFNSATNKRLAVDPNITHDGMHWRSPGDFSVPVFVLQAVLHSLAVRDSDRT